MQVILVPFSLAAIGTITGGQLFIEELSWQTILRHVDYMSYSTQLPFYDEDLSAEGVSALEDLNVWNAVSSCQPENTLKTPDVKRFKLVCM